MATKDSQQPQHGGSTHNDPGIQRSRGVPEHPLRGTSLPDDVEVYMALRNAAAGAGGRLSPEVFLLRYPDEEGISISESREGAIASQRETYGVATMTVARIRSAKDIDGVPLGLDVIADPTPDDPSHALIIGVPPYAPRESGSRQPALDVADAIVRSVNPSVETWPRRARVSA